MTKSKAVTLLKLNGRIGRLEIEWARLKLRIDLNGRIGRLESLL